MANDLEFRIGAQLTEIKTALAGLREDFDKTGKKGKKAGEDAGKGFDGIERTVQRATTALQGFLTVYTALQALRGLTNITDEYARIESQLRLATDSQEAYNVAQKETLRIAQLTRAPLADTVSTYAALERSTEQLAPSQEELVRVLETVNKSIALTPVAAATAQASLVQFGQALSGDFKNGSQELNSILEQTPGLAEAIADGLGVPTASLKKMGEEGKLSAELVFNALLRISQQVDEKFKEIPATVGGAMTQLRNDLLVTFGEADVTPLLVAIGELRDTLTDPAVQAGLITLADGMLTAAAATVEFTAAIANFITTAAEELSASINGVAVDDVPRLERSMKSLQNQIEALEESKRTSMAAGDEAFVASTQAGIDRLTAELNRLQTLLDGNKTPDSGETPEQRTERLAKEAAARMAAANALREQALAEAQLAKDAEGRQKQVDTMLASLQDEAATTGKTTAETTAYRLAILGATDAEIARGLALGEAVDQLKAKAEADKEAAQAAEEAGRIEQKIAEEMVEVQLRVLEASGQTVVAARIRLQNEFAELFAGLQASGNTEGIKLVQGLIDTEVARTQFDEIKRQFDQVTADLQARQEALANQVTVGALQPAVADQQQREARDVALQQLQALTAQMQALAQATNDPALLRGAEEATAALQSLAVEGLQGLDAAVVGLRASWAQMQRTFTQTTVDAGVNALTQLFTDLADGSKTAKESVAEFARGFLASMAQVAARALATYATLQILEAFFPGAGKLAAATASASVQHRGGMAGTGPRRRVDPLMFLNAPRFHDGGVVGLKADEVPAVLQTGEEVLARDDPRNQANGGGGSGYRIINVVDPSMAGEYLESPAGEQSIMNVITRNGSAVRQLLGG